MFSNPFKKRKTKTESTFCEREKLFWAWFTTRSQIFWKAIQDRAFDEHIPEFSSKMSEILPGVAWVFGPGTDDDSHSLTLSPEGNKYSAFLLSKLIARAPELKGWIFYDSRQPSPEFRTLSMEIVGQQIKAEQIWVSPKIDNENEEIDLVIWNPLFEELPDNARQQITFLWLDEALGEFVTENRIGAIDINDGSLENAIPLSELPDFVKQTENSLQWEQLVPGECYSSYKNKEKGEFAPTYPRSDVIVGTTRLFALVRDHSKAEGSLEHPLPHLGVDYLYLQTPIEQFTAGEQINERADLENTLEDAFAPHNQGYVLGGASATDNLYIDLICTDGERSLKIIENILQKHPLGKYTAVKKFTI